MFSSVTLKTVLSTTVYCLVWYCIVHSIGMLWGHCWKKRLVNSVLLLLVRRLNSYFSGTTSCCYVQANMAPVYGVMKFWL